MSKVLWLEPGASGQACGPPCSCVWHGDFLDCQVRPELWTGVARGGRRPKVADGLGLSVALVCSSTLTPGRVLGTSGSSWSGARAVLRLSLRGG